MTAVISFVERHPAKANSGSLMFVGDLLVSGASDTSSLLVPTVGPISTVFPNGSGFVPINLAQKIVTFGGDFIAGWSGPVVAARSFFRSLYDEYQGGRLDAGALERHIEELGQSEVGRELQFILALTDEHQMHFNASVKAIEMPPFEAVFALGSGGNSLIDSLRFSVENPGDWIRNSDDGFADARLMRLAGDLVQGEVVDRQSLLNYWGGGFEAVVRRPGRFERIDKALHVFLRASDNSGAVRLHYPHRIIYIC